MSLRPGSSRTLIFLTSKVCFGVQKFGYQATIISVIYHYTYVWRLCKYSHAKVAKILLEYVKSIQFGRVILIDIICLATVQNTINKH